MAARIRLDHPAVTWWCPQLPPSPQQAMKMVLEGVASWPRSSMAVVGSSLGGFYATWVAEQFQCKAVLLNPAVYPVRDLVKRIGEQTAWHDPEERFFFEPEFIEQLRDFQCGGPAQPTNYFVVIAKGDELLDWREMQARYPGAALRLLEGSDHALSDFDEHLGSVLAFLDPVSSGL